jgi:hypothetical protein
LVNKTIKCFVKYPIKILIQKKESYKKYLKAFLKENLDPFIQIRKSKNFGLIDTYFSKDSTKVSKWINNPGKQLYQRQYVLT